MPTGQNVGRAQMCLCRQQPPLYAQVLTLTLILHHFTFKPIVSLLFLSLHFASEFILGWSHGGLPMTYCEL